MNAKEDFALSMNLINNSGDGNTINQVMGGGTIYDLDINGLADEYKHSEKLVWSHCIARIKRSVIEIVAAVIFLAFFVLVAWKEGAFESLGSLYAFLVEGTKVGSLASIAAIILFVLTIISGSWGGMRFIYPTKVEQRHGERKRVIFERAEDIGVSKSQWKEALKKSKLR